MVEASPGWNEDAVLPIRLRLLRRPTSRNRRVPGKGLKPRQHRTALQQKAEGTCETPLEQVRTSRPPIGGSL